MRTTTFAPGEIYHLCGRGVNRNTLFFDEYDYARFLFLLLHLQSPTQIHNTYFYTNAFVKKSIFPVGPEILKCILKGRYLDLTSFCLMPNHFHITIQNKEEMAPSVYMQRVLTAYSKYFNKKYDRKGHVFEGPFRSVHVSNNTQLLHLSAYIHKNPATYTEYSWSSYGDYVGQNRWGELLQTDLISGQFKTQTAYKDFVKSSTAKEK